MRLTVIPPRITISLIDIPGYHVQTSYTTNKTRSRLNRNITPRPRINTLVDWFGNTYSRDYTGVIFRTPSTTINFYMLSFLVEKTNIAISVPETREGH